MLNKNLNLILLVSAMVALAVLSRLVSHAWNFTILGGLALFSGLFFARKSVAFAVIFLSLLISDAMIGFHSQMPSVYFSFLLMVVLGSFLNLRSSRGIVVGTSLLGSLLFFFITNF